MLGPESINVDIVDPRSGGLGVIIAILAERGAAGLGDGVVEGTPVRTDCESLGSAGGTWTCVIGVDEVLTCVPGLVSVSALLL